jgi:uncharacterized protein with HEPN domain
MKERASILVGQLRDAAQSALDYTEGLTKEDFLADRRTCYAVALNLLVTGEIAAKLVRNFPVLIADNPHIPWEAMRGMRNRIAHGYHDIDFGVVWATVNDALPALITQLCQFLDENHV